MVIREALISDILQIQKIRRAVKENRLDESTIISDQLVAEYITRRGKGWVCEKGDALLGFAIVDMQDNNVWALFVHPDAEGQGVGSSLHKVMLDWYFKNGKKEIWLSTSPGTKAEGFYNKHGWVSGDILESGEIKFTLSSNQWRK